jgi:hypothetical protein
MPKKNPAIPSAVRAAVDIRDRKTCLRCGGGATAKHHRMRRREGGHGLWNVISLCDGCHRWAHANVTVARREGYIIPTFSQAPKEVPLRAYWDWVLLDEEGGLARTAAPSAAYLQSHG